MSVGLVQLGLLTHLAYRDKESGRRRTARFGLRGAPILAYDPDRRVASLVFVYPIGVVGRSSEAAAKEYAKTHWGLAGAGEKIDGHRALAPLVDVGELLSLTYTTEKGADSAPTDYRHAFGDGAKGSWLPPRLLAHRCSARRCAQAGRFAITGGTYHVSSHGIVG